MRISNPFAVFSPADPRLTEHPKVCGHSQELVDDAPGQVPRRSASFSSGLRGSERCPGPPGEPDPRCDNGNPHARARHPDDLYLRHGLPSVPFYHGRGSRHDLADSSRDKGDQRTRCGKLNCYSAEVSLSARISSDCFGFRRRMVLSSPMVLSSAPSMMALRSWDTVRSG